jgi:hypothetical protein
MNYPSISLNRGGVNTFSDDIENYATEEQMKNTGKICFKNID